MHALKKICSSLIFGCFLCNVLIGSPAADLFPFEPPKKFSLFIQQGLIDHPVSTSQPDAQAYFNQGLTLIYGFNHDAAYWSFKKASEIDPQLAMAYWGMALALGQNINLEVTGVREKKAYDLIQKAIQLSKNATDNEQAYIKALSQRYTNDPQPDLKQLARNYFTAMEELKKRFQDDLDAAVLFAESGLNLNPWKQWTSQGEPIEGTLEIVAVLENVLKRDPNHLGANHYYIHAIEASEYPERALMSAERLRKLLPASGHILHMPGHIYLLTGNYHLAAICNEEAVTADRAYIDRFGMRGIYPLHYLSHNLYFLSRAYSLEGRFEDAKRTGDELYDFYAPHFKMMPELEFYVPTSLFIMLRFQRWKDVLALSPPPADMQITNVLWHFARAMSYAALKQIPDAEKEQSLFTDGKNHLPNEAAYGGNQAKTIMEIADLSLKSKIAEMKEGPARAIHALQKAALLQDKLHYNEPPDWLFPIKESLGGIFLRLGNFEEAEKNFREDLGKHPRNGRSLFGLWQSLRGQGRHSDASWVEREWEKAWQNSTTDLTINDL
ncbi:MAG: hypothetical protein H0V82_08740 [Candidatus Protochlamydia sp.]|nr:hypothetical protein [Candidatus Protochlamydia sp.]